MQTRSPSDKLRDKIEQQRQEMEQQRAVLSRTPSAQEIVEQKELWDTALLPLTEIEYSLSEPGLQPDPLLLKANVPSTIYLQGTPDLTFDAFAIGIEAGRLLRNMADGFWGTTSSGPGSGGEQAKDGSDGQSSSVEYSFPGLTAIDLVAVRLPDSDGIGEMDLTYQTNGKLEGTLALKPFARIGHERVGVKKAALRTDLIQVAKPEAEAAYLFRSASLPARIGIALGDDSPLQFFPSEMALGGSVVSRDLSGPLNAAWQQARREGNTVTVALKLTSLTDGIVQLAFNGTWRRAYASEAVPVSLDAFNPTRLAVQWPFAGQAGDVSLRLSGKLPGGVRQRLVAAAGADDMPFAVRAGEKLEIAQAILLGEGPDPVPARQVSAVWLFLPALPDAEQKVELRLAKAAGSPPVPSDDLLARVVAILPVDASAYVKAGNGYWFRAGFDAPVKLDGVQMVQSFFVVAAGRGEGTPLGHQRSAAQGGTPGADWLPANAGEAGPALIRNLERSRAWEAQSFNRQRSHWTMDVELVPLGADYGLAMSAVLIHQSGSERQAGFAGAGPGAASPIDWKAVSEPPGDRFAVQLQSSGAASLTAQFIINHLVMVQDAAVDTAGKKKK